MGRAVAVSYDHIPVKRFGDVWFALSQRGIWRIDCGISELAFVEQLYRDGVTVVSNPKRTVLARRRLTEYFAGRCHSLGLPIDWSRVDGFTR